MRIFSLLFVLLSAFSWGKIYVCMPFFNELDVLEIHLETLYNHVDHFVISECSKTFSGDAKPFYFEENKERFARFSDKIIHLANNDTFGEIDPWNRERFQKNLMLKGLEHCSANDIILIPDCDEIVMPEALSRGLQALERNPEQVVLFELIYMRYFLDHVYKEDRLWRAPVMAYFSTVRRISTEGVRYGKVCGKMHVIENGGWHFSYMGGIARVEAKLKSFPPHGSDSEWKERVEKAAEHARATLKNGCYRIEIDETFPPFILENQALMEERGLIDPSRPFPKSK